METDGDQWRRKRTRYRFITTSYADLFSISPLVPVNCLLSTIEAKCTGTEMNSHAKETQSRKKVQKTKHIILLLGTVAACLQDVKETPAVPLKAAEHAEGF